MFLCAVGNEVVETQFGDQFIEASVTFSVEQQSTASIFITYASYGDKEEWKAAYKDWTFIPYHQLSDRIEAPSPMFPNYTVNAVASLEPWEEYTIRAWAGSEDANLYNHSPIISITVVVGEYTGNDNILYGGVA